MGHEDLGWRTASACGNGNCVEVAVVGGRHNHVAVRHSQHHDQIVVYTLAEWATFVEGVKRGEFDIDPV
jgi:hypothetical protein